MLVKRRSTTPHNKAVGGVALMNPSQFSMSGAQLRLGLLVMSGVVAGVSIHRIGQMHVPLPLVKTSIDDNSLAAPPVFWRSEVESSLESAKKKDGALLSHLSQGFPTNHDDDSASTAESMPATPE